MVVKTAPKTSKAVKDDVLEQKSPAEFFADNRNIAGFDNVRSWIRVTGRKREDWVKVHPVRPAPIYYPPTQPGKCLYTTIRELVENALDAAESIRVLPDIDITM